VARQRGRDAEHPARDQHPALAGPRVRRAARGVVREQGRDRACHGYRCVRSRFFWCSFRRIWLGIDRDMALFHIYIYRIVVFYYYYCGFIIIIVVFGWKSCSSRISVRAPRDRASFGARFVGIGWVLMEIWSLFIYGIVVFLLLLWCLVGNRCILYSLTCIWYFRCAFLILMHQWRLFDIGGRKLCDTLH
jgi:hypothetical protein